MKDGPINTTLKSAMDETEEVIYTIVEELFQKTGIHPQEVPHSLYNLS